jgi:predicted AAA+ superfamily ATPase
VKVEQTTLRDETLTCLQRLTAAVANTSNTALVFSLQSSKRESLDYVNLLQTVDHLAARKDQRREPVEGNEILAVIQRRLLAKVPDAAEVSPAAAGYQEIVTQMRRAGAQTAGERQQAEEEGIALRDRVRAAYPFHPALIDLMRERWAAIPEFQRTRGALRFLASCLRAAHREGKSRAMLGPGDVPIHDAEVRLAFFKEVGQQAPGD